METTERQKLRQVVADMLMEKRSLQGTCEALVLVAGAVDVLNSDIEGVLDLVRALRTGNPAVDVAAAVPRLVALIKQATRELELAEGAVGFDTEKARTALATLREARSWLGPSVDTE